MSPYINAPSGRSPLSTVIIPMFNAERTISATLRSILSQSEPNIEIVVVDDQSTDRSRAIVSEFEDPRIHLVNGPGAGIAACLNTGISEASGDILMRCDADDLYPPDRIKQQVDWLGQHPDHVAVCGSFSTMDEHGRKITDMQCGREAIEITNELLQGITRTTLCSYAIRSTSVRLTGGFRTFFESAEDIDFQFRIAEVGKVSYLPIDWYIWRIHQSSKTHTQKTDELAFFEDAAKRFLVQRQTFGKDDLQNGRNPSIPRKNGRSASSTSHVQSLLLGRAWREHRDGQRLTALKTGVRAVAAKPGSIAAWKSLASLAIKPRSRSTAREPMDSTAK